MPKCLMVDPNEKRKATFIQFTPIPVNQYSKTVRDELSRYTTGHDPDSHL